MTWPNQMCAATQHVRQTCVDADLSLPQIYRLEPDGMRNQELIAFPLSAHSSCDRNLLSHTGPDISTKLTLSIISG